MMLMIDLFSGLGGASEAFVQSGRWSVLRYENNAALGYVPFTQLVDLRTFEIKCRHEIDIIWASPPCQDFSRAYDAPAPKAERAGIEFEPDLTLVKKAKEIIDNLKPRYWVIENVVGAIKEFEAILGEPRQIIGPFVLWGNFPLLTMGRDFKHSKASVDKRHSPIRSNIRAQIPLEISSQLLRAVENQRTLFDAF
jgi:hypothetical protein